MIIKITRISKGYQAECLTFDELSPKEIKKILHDTSLPKLILKIQNELTEYFNDRKVS